MRQRKIYLASSWRNESQPYILAALLGDGHEVYDFRNPEPGNTGFRWSEIDPTYQSWTPRAYISALDTEIANKGFGLDFRAMQWADTCVLLLPCGRSAHIEAGWMAGAGKDVFILLSDVGFEPELMYKLATCVVDQSELLLAQLRERPLTNPHMPPSRRQ